MQARLRWVEQPELRGYAAAQVVVEKVPARGAPERDHGRSETDGEGGRYDTRASPTRRQHPPCHPNPYPATTWRRGGAEVRWLTATAATCERGAGAGSWGNGEGRR
eukprot:scaffold75731_cov28-Phaeocystis_antarctica.AAC.1